ncbi:MAG: tRNA 2-thiouridine(34) synthase MnmA [Acidimicrobiales bacterium]
MRILVALSGGVDSSVAAALLADEGHEVVGATMKLWGGASDSGCCSVSDVDDARRVADRLGIDHHVFNFTEEFEAKVVSPYVAAHADGLTPNPCIECNRHLKFRSFLDRATRLGFDAVATGHHAWVEPASGAQGPRLLRGADPAKDQSYVLSCLTSAELAKLVLPIGRMTKTQVRAVAASRGLPTASKPDSQDVCFVLGGSGTSARERFLGDRLPLHAAVVVDSSGIVVGSVPAVELVTVGQRRGLGVSAGSRQFAVRVDVAARRVEVGTEEDLADRGIRLTNRTWVERALPVGSKVLAQASAHGRPWEAVTTADGLAYEVLRRRVAPGQTVALYRRDEVVGSGIAMLGSGGDPASEAA